ncbi:ABC transporter permease, partial [Xanthomonas perforans]|nr:ABC transporter permease [Xanthomonas perforans]
QRLARPTNNSAGGVDQGNYSMLLPLRINYTAGQYIIRVTDQTRRAEVMKSAVAALMKLDNSRLVLKQQTYSEIRAEYF